MSYRRDELGERNQTPTPLRRRQARLAGQVARSGDLTSVVVLSGGLVVLGLTGRGLLRALVDLTAALLGGDADVTGLGKAGSSLAGALPPVLWALAPTLLAVLVLAVGANLLQVGAVVSAGPLRPDAARLSPARGLARLLSLRSLIRWVLAMLKIAAVAGAGWLTVRGAMPRIAAASGLDPSAMLGEAGAMVAAMAVRVGAVLLVLAAVDYACQRWLHERDLRMTRPELKEDLRQTEGDSAVRARRRKLGREMLGSSRG